MTYSTDGIKCPYCNFDNGIPEEHREEDVIEEYQCSNCDKNFVYHVSYSTSYDSNKADCLNGKKHKWEKIIGYPEEFFKNKYRCKDCDKQKVLSEVSSQESSKKHFEGVEPFFDEKRSRKTGEKDEEKK